jgi:nucleotide-binding universal stress UspA family protein
MSITRVVCGVGGDSGVGVARRALRLAPDGTPIVLVGAVDADAAALSMQPFGGELDAAQLVPAAPVAAIDLLEDAVRDQIERVRAALAPGTRVETRLTIGSPALAILDAAGEEEGVLVAAAAPRQGRFLGMLSREAPDWLLHEARDSVLLARGPDEARDFPRTVAVGIDGSPPSAAAARVAGEIAGRREAELGVIVASGGRGVDRDGVARILAQLPEHAVREDARAPVDALTDTGADLVVVGSRGLHGVRALGSVSQRVAHRAGTSVLVVR